MLTCTAVLTKSPIEIHPSFNPMIGPSSYVLINMGARFMPCMHNVDGVQNAGEEISWGCPNSTSNSVGVAGGAVCSLSELCGFSGVPNPGGDSNPNFTNINQNPQPNQWFRFIIPMFLHAGLIHIGFNMLLQMTLGKEMELAIGPIRFFLVYVCSGIFGFVLGGNFAAAGIASTGASGALFGILALNLLDLLYTWGERQSPWQDFGFIMLDVIISFVLGLLPGLDNFSHIGGFLMGLVLGICILRSPNALRKRIHNDEPPYTPVMKASDGDDPNAGVTGFVKSPIGFFKGRKPAWWVWWLARALCLAAVFIIFILLLNNFYIYRKTCSWCKYLSCIVSSPLAPVIRYTDFCRILIIGAILATLRSRLLKILQARGVFLIIGIRWRSYIRDDRVSGSDGMRFDLWHSDGVQILHTDRMHMRLAEVHTRLQRRIYHLSILM